MSELSADASRDACLFNPGILDERQIKCLQRVIDLAKTWEPVTLELCGSMLEYQIFSDMNHYQRKE